jgi:hypothetical protein
MTELPAHHQGMLNFKKVCTGLLVPESDMMPQTFEKYYFRLATDLISRPLNRPAFWATVGVSSS